MREIKFRAYVRETNQMSAVATIHYGDDGAALTVLVQPAPKGEYITRSVDGESCVLIQFTGLRDRNGREIYEGDILTAGTGHTNTVEWNSSCGTWTLDGLQEFMMKLPDGAYFPLHSFSEVIGNVHENPELLKGAA